MVWPAVIGVLQIRKRFDVKTTDWGDFLGFLGTFLFVIYDRHGGSIFSPEFQFLRAQNGFGKFSWEPSTRAPFGCHPLPGSIQEGPLGGLLGEFLEPTQNQSLRRVLRVCT